MENNVNAHIKENNLLISKHRSELNNVIKIAAGLILMIILSLFVIAFTIPHIADNGEKLEKGLSTNMSFIGFGAFTICFGITMAIYRFHLKEIGRIENQIMGLRRIDITIGFIQKLETPHKDYNIELIKAVLHETFKVYYSLNISEEKIKKPLEGHFTTDIIVDFLNAFKRNYEIANTPKQNEIKK